MTDDERYGVQSAIDEYRSRIGKKSDKRKAIEYGLTVAIIALALMLFDYFGLMK